MNKITKKEELRKGIQEPTRPSKGAALTQNYLPSLVEK